MVDMEGFHSKGLVMECVFVWEVRIRRLHMVHWQLQTMLYSGALWNLCYLCGKPDCNIRHILSSCRVPQVQGRHLWTHNNVLCVIANDIQSFLLAEKVQSNGDEPKYVVRESGKTKEMKVRKLHFSIFHRFSDLERPFNHITESGGT